MKSPFPGMDPYLEDPALWPDVHQRIITYASDRLQEQVGERYYVGIGERIYVEVPDQEQYPDVAIMESRRKGPPSEAPRLEPERDEPIVLVLEPIERREVYLEIRDARTRNRVVTVIEVLSPSNKRGGDGRKLYLEKQKNVLRSDANLVEIDLLRGGLDTVAVPPERLVQSAYRIAVSRADDRRRRELYPIGLERRLPRIAIPLIPGDADVVLDLQAVLEEAYRKGAYARRIDYNESPPEPPLEPEDESLLRRLLARRADAP